MEYNDLKIKLLLNNITQNKLAIETDIEKTRINRLVNLPNNRLYKSIYLHEYNTLCKYFDDKFLDDL